MTDERPILIVNEAEWTPALIAEAERDGWRVKANRWVPRRTAYIIRDPELLTRNRKAMTVTGLSDPPTSVADG